MSTRCNGESWKSGKGWEVLQKRGIKELRKKKRRGRRSKKKET